MKRSWLLAALIAIPSTTPAADLEQELRGRWLGAWVVTTVDTYSNCQGLATNNRIHGELVHGQGQHRFDRGELARVEKVDAKRSRVDLHLLLSEPLLVAYQEGPFTLYAKRSARSSWKSRSPERRSRARSSAGSTAGC